MIVKHSHMREDKPRRRRRVRQRQWAKPCNAVKHRMVPRYAEDVVEDYVRLETCERCGHTYWRETEPSEWVWPKR